MHKNIESILRAVIIFWSFYAFVEGCLYFFNIRLGSVATVWPVSALSYADLTGKIVGSVFFFICAISFIGQRDLNKYKTLVKLSGFWAVFHGGMLLFLGISQDYGKNFFGLSSLHVWLPFYNQYLLLEGLALLVYSLIVYLWSKENA